MIYWDPNPTAFTVPYIGLPIRWYGILFAFGFALGFPLFKAVLRRFFFSVPEYTELEILRPDLLPQWGKVKKEIRKRLNENITQGMVRTSFPIRWRREVEKSGVAQKEKVFARLSFDCELAPFVLGLYRKAHLIADRFVIYVLIGLIVGARLGHFLFYEDLSEFFSDPWEIFRTWEGGLASHGAAFGIILAVFLFTVKLRKVTDRISWVRLLDFLTIPAALCAALIRVGNFMNQEVLGKATTLPWGVIFGHPVDYDRVTARHPVQLYEAFFYALVFWILWRLSFRPRMLSSEGRLIGLFLILVFGFRFLIEFLKPEQSVLIDGSGILNMGQLLSIPLIFLGFFFYRKSYFA